MSKELKLTLNTGDSGETSFVTDVIKGTLKFLVMASERMMSIEINSELGYPIYKKLDHVGIVAFKPQADIRDKEGHKQNMVGAEFYLNEKLEIVVQGSKNTEFKIRIRYI